MVIPEGYKQTEVGIIPEKWNVCYLKNLTQNIGDVDHWMPESESYGIPYIMTGNIRDDGTIDYRNAKLISKEAYDKLTKRIKTEYGDLIFARYASIGRTAWVDTHMEFIVSYSCATLKFRNTIESKFALYYFQSANAKSQLDGIINSGTQKNIGINDLENLLIPFPTEYEVKTIVEALSTISNLISTLEKQYAKKKAIKQGAMQELLTGKRRLPGFSGEWCTKKLEKVSPLQRGFDLTQSQICAGMYPIVYSNGILARHNKAVVKGPGVVTGRSGTIGKVHFIDSDFWPHNTTLWVTDFKGNDPLFIFYLLKTVNWNDYMTGSGVPTLNRNDVHKKEMRLPADISEQKAIAGLLSEMDDYIKALEQKLAKYQKLKQGMMQQLLTGKIRLA